MVKTKKGNKIPKKVSGKAEKAQQPNPFELKVQRKKHDVFGRNVKGTKQNVGQARDQSIKERKNTLLVEYKQRDKANTFVDRRFGEGDQSLSLEDKMLMRFQKERQKVIAKGSRFNLEDEDELTHLGQSLGALTKDDFTEEMELSEGEEIDAATVAEDHFGGGLFKRKTEQTGKQPRAAAVSQESEEVDSLKTKQERMDEIIAKSKQRKVCLLAASFCLSPSSVWWLITNSQRIGQFRVREEERGRVSYQTKGYI
eukprot:GCRY01002693.1.p2 GENE.GCRY01002693.1~~GCRY01002693.1.p2  ORF type:complete len:255 (-),score=57.03 GCRY01002693.1:217-981(-)